MIRLKKSRFAFDSELVQKQNLFAFDSVPHNFHTTVYLLSDDKSKSIARFSRFFLFGIDLILKKKIDSHISSVSVQSAVANRVSFRENFPMIWVPQRETNVIIQKL